MEISSTEIVDIEFSSNEFIGEIKIVVEGISSVALDYFNDDIGNIDSDNVSKILKEKVMVIYVYTEAVMVNTQTMVKPLCCKFICKFYIPTFDRRDHKSHKHFSNSFSHYAPAPSPLSNKMPLCHFLLETFETDLFNPSFPT